MTDYSPIGKTPPTVSMYDGESLAPLHLGSCRCGLLVPSPPCATCLSPAVRYCYDGVTSAPTHRRDGNVPMLATLLFATVLLYLAVQVDGAPESPRARDAQSRLD